MDLNNIMRNIYGENASQSFDSLSLSGGKINYKRAKVKYLDEISSYTEPHEYENEISMSYKASKIQSNMFNFSYLSGGSKKEEKEIILPSAGYTNDSDVDLFIKEFYLEYLVANPHKNTIFIIPSSSTLKKMVDELHAEFKQENISPYTQEASKYVAGKDLSFKNYIFDVYGKESPNNEDFPYRVPEEFPNINNSNATLRRTNRLSNVYFFKFESESKISVSINKDMTGSASLKFIGKAQNEVFILKGDVPPSNGKSNKSNILTLTGGAKHKNSLRSYFVKLVRKNNDDLDAAAYDFIGSIKDARKIAKYYSGDYLHTAFSIMATNPGDPNNPENGNGPSDPNPTQVEINTEPSPDEVADTHQAIINEYTPIKSQIKMDKVYDILPRILKNTKMSKSGIEASKNFISTLRKMYKTTSAPDYMMKADIATALCKKSNNIDGVRNAFQVIDAIDNLDAAESENSYLNSTIKMSQKSTLSPLVNTVYNAISSSPFIGSLAKEYTPLPLYVSRRKKSMKPKKAFEDTYNFNDNDSFQFSILNTEETTQQPGQDTEQQTPQQPENTQQTEQQPGTPATTQQPEQPGQPGNGFQDIDIKSFF